MTETKFHPSVFIQEEMDARGWDRDRLAFEMCDGTAKDWQIWRLALDFYMDIGPSEPRMSLNADAFAKAFGVAETLFLNLQSAWRESLPQIVKSKPPADAGTGGGSAK